MTAGIYYQIIILSVHMSQLHFRPTAVYFLSNFTVAMYWLGSLAINLPIGKEKHSAKKTFGQFMKNVGAFFWKQLP
jgi:hypothetical protein